MTLRLFFKLGQVVYLKADQELKGVVTGIVERPQAVAYKYLVCTKEGESEYYDIELLGESERKASLFRTMDD